jgi:hypothetical protein
VVVAGRVGLTVRHTQALQTLCAESVRGNLGEEDPIHCDHGDGGCPVLVLSARTSNERDDVNPTRHRVIPVPQHHPTPQAQTI